MSISGSSQGTNSAFEGGGPPEAWAGGPTPPGLYIYVSKTTFSRNGKVDTELDGRRKPGKP